MFRARVASVRLKLLRSREFCTDKNKPTEPDYKNQKMESDLSRYDEQYRQLQNLDFMTAAKMVFSEPAKKRKFGIDFHLVQLFFACLPSLAVYLVAQYARKEMKRMDAELERKKKEEEEKAKEIEAKAIEEKEAGSAELSEVKVRLNKLEETIQEIVVQSKKQRRGTVTKDQEDSEKRIAKQDDSTYIVRPESDKTTEKNESSKQKAVKTTSGSGGGVKVSESPPPSTASQQDQ